VKRVLIIGGYGNFGSYIARALAGEPNIALLIGGRSLEKADAFAAGLGGTNRAQTCVVDIDADIAANCAKSVRTS
jgi:saccharopine dehydrogenase-like NADP-dependent oxidoreductase